MKTPIKEKPGCDPLKPGTIEDLGLYRALVRACPDAVIITDLEGTITEASDKALMLHGGNAIKDLIGKKAFDLIAPEDRDRAADNLRRTLATGYVDNVEYRLVRKDGTWFTGELNASVVRDRDGNPAAFIAATRDVTESRKTVQTLHDREEMYHSLFNRAVDAIFTVAIRDDGMPGTIMEANEAACRNLGYSREELQSKTLEDLDDMENLPEKQACMHQLQTTGTTFFETHVLRKDGTKIPVEVNAQVMRMGANTMILTIARDMTDRKRVEAEIRRSDKLESLGTLAGGIAHDFNNFLTGIVGNLSLVLGNKDNLQGETEHIRKAMDVAMRARSLTKQLLTFSAGGAPVMKTGSIADIVVDMVEIAMSGSNIKCDLDIASGTWLVDMDEGQIAQVVSNLVINARQSMKKGGIIQIEVKNEVIEEGRFPEISAGRFVCIRVTDHGEGIPPENLLRIFDPYFSTKSFGYGLGLAASLSIVKNHGGYIDVESQVGEGATFRVYLPASGKKKVAEKSTPSVPSLESRKILVMDDNRIVCEVCAKMLSRLGGEVIVTTDGRQALNAASEVVRQGNRIDLAILDLTIPGETGGQEVFQELKKIDPVIKGIVSSGYYTSNVMSNFRKHGFSGVLHKPYLFEDLCEVLNTVLENP